MSALSADRARMRASARILALLVLGAWLLLPPTASEATEPEIEFTVRPAHPDYRDPRTVAWLLQRADPGERIRDAVVVQNLGDVPLDLVLYPADAATTAGGEFTLEPKEAPDDGVAGWVSLERSKISLDPGQRDTIPLHIRVPQNATPGDHPGAIVARLARPIGEGPVGTYLAVGTRLHLRVSGELVFDLTLRDLQVAVEDGRPRFHFELENTGNTVLTVSGSYGLKGWLDDGNAGLGRPMTLVPGARVVREVHHPDRLLGGPYSAAFLLRYGEGRQLSAEDRFFVPFPWPLLVALRLAVAVLAALALRALLRRRSLIRLDLQPAG